MDTGKTHLILSDVAGGLIGSHVGWVEWVNANRYLTRTEWKIFNDSAAWLDGMKPNIPTHTVIFKLGFTGFWEISRGIENRQLSKMFDFLNGAVQPNLHRARKSGAFPLSIDRQPHADSILSWLIRGKLNRPVHLIQMKEVQYSKFDGVSIRFQPLGFVKFTWCAKSEK